MSDIHFVDSSCFSKFAEVSDNAKIADQIAVPKAFILL